MGTVIAVTSGKGGTGKTSITGGVAACLAQPWNKKAIGQQFELPALELSLEIDAQIGRSYDAR